MRTYKIFVRGKSGSKVVKGETPVEAFEGAFPNMELIPVSSEKEAMIRMELLDGERSSVSYVNTCEILGVDGTNMTSESEPYWNAVDAKYRRRFYDLKEELVTNADGSSEKRYVNSQSGYCSFTFFSVDEDRVTGGVSFTNMWNEFQIYKDATITALSLINLLTPLE